jgi:hypothetical protein
MEERFLREYRSGKTYFLKVTAGGIYRVIQEESALL